MPLKFMTSPIMKRTLFALFPLSLQVLSVCSWGAEDVVTTPVPTLAARLKAESLAIVYESYVGDNWELFVSRCDGSEAVNLTQTPEINEHYPQVSPDGMKICFSVDTGEGRETVRSLWVMDRDGKNRKKIVESAREPFWSPDSKRVGFLPQEYPKFNVIDFYTKGMSFYDLATGEVAPHPNSEKLHHLYNPSFSRNGKWIAAICHAGMGQSHAIFLIEANGSRLINLKIPGCRPCLSPDNKSIAWGSSDNQLSVADIDLEAETPVVSKPRLLIQDEKMYIYHIDWSPDGRYLAFSQGPASKGDPTKKGTFQSACEIVGVYAPGWNILAVSSEKSGLINVGTAGDAEVVKITTNGASNKEPAWMVRPPVVP